MLYTEIVGTSVGLITISIISIRIKKSKMFFKANFVVWVYTNIVTEGAMA